MNITMCTNTAITSSDDLSRRVGSEITFRDSICSAENGNRVM